MFFRLALTESLVGQQRRPIRLAGRLEDSQWPIEKESHAEFLQFLGMSEVGDGQAQRGETLAS